MRGNERRRKGGGERGGKEGGREGGGEDGREVREEDGKGGWEEDGKGGWEEDGKRRWEEMKVGGKKREGGQGRWLGGGIYLRVDYASDEGERGMYEWT